MTVAWILEGFSTSGEPLPHLWRPLVIGTLAAVLLTVGLWLVSRRRLLPVVVWTVALMLLLKAWPLLSALLVIITWRSATALGRRLRGSRPLAVPASTQITRIANVFAALMLAVTLLSMGAAGAFASLPPASQRGQAAEGVPNLYMVLLDGYPRADTLGELGHDNSDFARELEQRGFSVASESRSNYPQTLLTLSSMMNGQYLNDPGDPPALADARAWENRQLGMSINGGRLLADLRGRGYTIVNSPSPFGSATIMTADILLRGDNLTQVEEWLIRKSFLRELVPLVLGDFVEDQLRRGVLGPIEAMEMVASDPPRTPFFMLSHVLSPHPPFLFGATGEELPLPPCYEAACSPWTTQLEGMGLSAPEYASLLGGQIEYLNGRLLRMVDNIAAADPQGVIILFSDHGARFNTKVSDEHYRSFFAARSPGHESLFPDDVSPVNILPILANAYFHATLPVHNYRAFASDGDALNQDP